jgi:hypothetical protein
MAAIVTFTAEKAVLGDFFFSAIHAEELYGAECTVRKKLNAWPYNLASMFLGK